MEPEPKKASRKKRRVVIRNTSLHTGPRIRLPRKREVVRFHTIIDVPLITEDTVDGHQLQARLQVVGRTIVDVRWDFTIVGASIDGTPIRYKWAIFSYDTSQGGPYPELEQAEFQSTVLDGNVTHHDKQNEGGGPKCQMW